MKRLMACSIFALYPVIAVCAPGRLLRIQTSEHKFYMDFYKTLVRAKGLEPSTSTLARLRSSQLSYARTAQVF